MIYSPFSAVDKNSLRNLAVNRLPLFLALFFLTRPLQAAEVDYGKLGVANKAQMDKAIERMKSSLVRIRVVSSEYRDGREIRVQEVGSGSIITKDGYIITNHHVSGHAVRLFCTLWNREEVEADLVGTDPSTDISVIQLRPGKKTDYEYAVFGDSTKMKVGDPVLAMGCPMALSQSITLGILSNTEMVMPGFWGGNQFRLDGEDVGGLVRWMAHDAAIYGGNSGGPLVNMKGEIIGINEISYGLSGAIPGNLAHSIASELMAHGKIRRAWLGFDLQPLFKNERAKKGILISSVMEGSPADLAGMQTGDILLSLSGKKWDVHFEEQLPDIKWQVATLPVDKKVSALILHDGKEKTVEMTPAERSRIYLPEHELKSWGIAASDISFLLAKGMKRTNTDGVLIHSVRPGGPAGECKPGLQYGDVLVEVDGKPVHSLSELEEVTRVITQGKTGPVPALAIFERKAQRLLSVVKVGIQSEKDPALEVSKAWLPVDTHVITREIASHLGQPGMKGFYVSRVYAHSTAEKAGLKNGDFIVSLDGDKLTASGPEHQDELTTLTRQYDIGKTVELGVLRGKESLKVQVELMRSPRLEREMKKYRNLDFDFTARDVCFFDTADEEWSADQKGALVEEVKSGSWAELALLSQGDLIIELNGKAIGNVDDLSRELKQVSEQKKSFVVMKVLRGIHTSYLEFEPKWKS